MKFSGTGSVQKLLVTSFWEFYKFLIVAIVNIFNDLWSVFITFYAWNKFKLETIQGKKYFCAFFYGIFEGKCDSFFPPTRTNIDSEMLSYLVQVYCFQLKFLKLFTVRTGGEEKIHSKVADCFYLKVLILVNLSNWSGENLESLIVHFSKENYSSTKKR